MHKTLLSREIKISEFEEADPATLPAISSVLAKPESKPALSLQALQIPKQDHLSQASKSSNSISSLMRSHASSYDSLKKFREDFFKKEDEIQLFGLKSHEDEVHDEQDNELYDVYHHLPANQTLEQCLKLPNPQFVHLYLGRFRQVCDDRKTARDSDIRNYAHLLEACALAKRPKRPIISFDAILKN